LSMEESWKKNSKLWISPKHIQGERTQKKKRIHKTNPHLSHRNTGTATTTKKLMRDEMEEKGGGEKGKCYRA